jgi:hypothetical protein
MKKMDLVPLQIEWDETDPDLDYWNGLGKEGQEKFIMDALHASIKNLGLTTDDT